MPKRSSNSERHASRGNTSGRSFRRSSAGPPGWVVAAVLALAICVVYGAALRAPLLFDDDATVRSNSSIKSVWPLLGTIDHAGPLRPSSGLPTTGRPLVNLSFALNYHFGRLNPTGYRVANLLIHFGSAWLLWLIVRRTLLLPYFAGRYASSAGWLALAVALIWAIHPLPTEAVIYITQRTELMMAIFYLATLYCSLRYWSLLPFPPDQARGEGELSSQRQHSVLRAAWLTLAVLACFCGMASKEVMVSAPIIVLLFERTFVAGSLMKALRQSWPLYLGLATTWLLCRRAGRVIAHHVVVDPDASALHVPEADRLALATFDSL